MKRLILILLILTLSLTACSGPVVLTSPSLHRETSAGETQDNGLGHVADYAALIKLIRQVQANTGKYPTRAYMSADKAGTAEAVNSQAATADKSAYSQTNIQVEGVDEADIIKTDGQYLYLVANNRLYIVDARDAANLKVLSTTAFTVNQETDKISTGESPVEMYLDVKNRRLTLIVSGWLYEKIPVTGKSAADPAAAAGLTREDAKSSLMMPYDWNNNKQYTSTRVYDLTDKKAPKMIRQFTQEGYYVSSRKIDAAIYVVSNQYKYQIYYDTGAEPEPAEIFPQTRDTMDPVSEKGWKTVAADKISILPAGDVGNQMVLAAIDTLKDASKPSVISVIGSSGTIYASPRYLYVAAYNYQWDGKTSSRPVYTTDIYRFKLAGAQISEAGKGSVNGNLLNQFSMDEHEGYFRIATTSQNWSEKNTTVQNNVFVLDSSLKVVGSVEGLAPGETIKSVRFMGGQVYVVTFRNVDPLFVIDLSQPTAPQVLGQLKIPGYSTYLHPYDENKLLGFGYDVRNEGNNAYNMGLKVSLFDISDFNSPKELSTILLGGRGSSADLLHNHKSLLFSLEKNLIAFPAQLTKTITNSPLEYGQPVFQGMLVLAVDSQNQLTLRGSITHFDKLNDPNGKPVSLTDKETQAFYGYDAISRGAWIGNILYTCSARQVRSAAIDTLAAIGQVDLPGYEDYQKTSRGIGNARGMLID